MKESLWGYYLVLLGIAVSTVMIMVSNMTTTNQQNYYLLKEVTNAAMIDAIDYAYYREYGSIKINTEKFVENFLRRFSEGISKTNTYKIDFYSIYENPPSVSIRVTSNTGDYNIAGDSTNIDVVNSIDAVMEANNEVTISKTFFSLPWVSCGEMDYISATPETNGYGRCRLMGKKQINLEFLESELKNEFDVDNFDSKKVEVINSEFLYVESDPANVDESVYAYGYLVENEAEAGTVATGEEDASSAEGSTSDDDAAGSASGGKHHKFYTYGGSNADLKSLVENAGSSYETGKSFFTTDVDNVNLGVVKRGGNFYLSYGLDYTCNSENKYLRWRLKEFYFNNSKSGDDRYINEETYNKLSEIDQNSYKNLLYETTKPTGIDEYHWPPEVHEEIYNNSPGVVEDKSFYVKAPYHGACLMGIWYKVDFRYNNAS